MAIIEDEFPLNIKPITIFESLLQQDNLTIELDNDIAITYSGKKDDDEINYKIKNILIQSENDKNIDFSSILEQKELNNQKKRMIQTMKMKIILIMRMMKLMKIMKMIKIIKMMKMMNLNKVIYFL